MKFTTNCLFHLGFFAVLFLVDLLILQATRERGGGESPSPCPRVLQSISFGRARGSRGEYESKFSPVHANLGGKNPSTCSFIGPDSCSSFPPSDRGACPFLFLSFLAAATTNQERQQIPRKKRRRGGRGHAAAADVRHVAPTARPTHLTFLFFRFFFSRKYIFPGKKTKEKSRSGTSRTFPPTCNKLRSCNSVSPSLSPTFANPSVLFRVGGGKGKGTCMESATARGIEPFLSM